jgi:hypothetical protein
MNALIMAMSLLLSSPSPLPAVVSPQLLVGEWRSEQGGTYHFYANGTYSWHAADMGDEGRWRLRGERTLDLMSQDAHGKTTHEMIVIDRVVHETLYVRTRYEREIWLKQAGP